MSNPADDIELDVRTLAHAQRRTVIFQAFNGMAASRSFVLVNDHDPVPLRSQFEALFAGGYTWESLEKGPRVWRVRITKTPVPAESLSR